MRRNHRLTVLFSKPSSAEGLPKHVHWNTNSQYLTTSTSSGMHSSTRTYRRNREFVLCGGYRAMAPRHASLRISALQVEQTRGRQQTQTQIYSRVFRLSHYTSNQHLRFSSFLQSCHCHTRRHLTSYATKTMSPQNYLQSVSFSTCPSLTCPDLTRLQRKFA